MKTNYLLLAFISFSSIFSQQINWAKSLPTTYGSKGILTDNAGNIYDYGGNFYTYSENLTFSQAYNNPLSFIYKYSSNGTLLSSKTWTTAFCIQKMVYDGSSSLYFAGVFSGNQVFDGVALNSTGGVDAMLGKMDLNGNLLWVKTLGGHQTDIANSLAFNPSKTAITITGGITDSLYINNTFIAGRNEKSMLMATFDLNGNLQSYKLIDFLGGTNDANCGIELFTDNDGNYIMHGQREGAIWSSNNPTGPENGRYIFKLDQNYNVQWSKFIISGACYYGYSCGGLGVCGNGDSYITSVCSSKYGGSPYVSRLNSSSGQVSWTIPNNSDGDYSFSYASGNSIFVLGIECADGCPCEGSHSGYAVVKKFDSNNQLQGELRIKNAYLNYITKSTDGTLYLLGSSYNGTKIGNDSIKGMFLVSLADIPCSAVALDTNQYYWLPKLFCDTLSLDAGAGYSNYLWSDGSTGRFLKTTQEGCYSVRVTENNGCVAYSMGSYAQKKQAPYPGQIDFVSYDNGEHKNVIHYQPGYQGVYTGRSYASFKKSCNGQVKTDTTSLFGYPIRFADTLLWGDTSQVDYSLTMMDECGYQSTESKVHKTMFLKVKQENNKVVLNWTKYIGFPYSKVYIRRGHDLSNMNEIATLDSNATSFIDSTATQNMVYQVKIYNTSYYYWTEVYSNPAGVGMVVGVAANQEAPNLFSVYPNPTQDDVYLDAEGLKTDNVEIKIVDITGSQVYSSHMSLGNSKIHKKLEFKAVPGVYFMEVSAQNNKQVIKIVKQ